MNRISATKCNTYETCPQWFYYNYVLKLLQTDNKNLLVGNAYHDALYGYYTGKNTLEDAIKKWLPRKTQEADLVRNMYERYLQEPVETGKNYDCEKKFYIDVPGLSAKLEGKFDRLENDKIVEYKTSSFKYKEEHIKTIQSRVYCYVAWRLTGKILPVVYSVVNKKTKMKPQTLVVDYTQKDLEKIPKELINILERINAGAFNKTPGIHCRWCPYGPAGTNNCK